MILQYIENPIDLLRDGIQDICEAIILFGSVAQGIAEKWSDIDICLVLKDYKEKNLVKRGIDKFHERFEPHFYDIKSFSKIKDFVVLDSLINGITR